MTCADFHAFADGDRGIFELTVAERAALSRHMDSCPSCVAEMIAHIGGMQALQDAINKGATNRVIDLWLDDHADAEYLETRYGE